MVFSRGRKRSREDDEAEAPTSWSPWNFMPQRKRARADAEERTCRLCFGGEEDGPLVQPCACRGTAKWVHKHCLEAWRRTAEREDAAYRCVQCMDHYRDALSIELLRDRLQVERAVGQTSSQVSHLAAAFELFAAINMIISPVTLLGGRLQAFQRHRDARLGVVRPGVLHEWRANHAEHKQRDREAVSTTSCTSSCGSCRLAARLPASRGARQARSPMGAGPSCPQLRMPYSWHALSSPWVRRRRRRPRARDRLHARRAHEARADHV